MACAFPSYIGFSVMICFNQDWISKNPPTSSSVERAKAAAHPTTIPDLRLPTNDPRFPILDPRFPILDRRHRSPIVDPDPGSLILDPRSWILDSQRSRILDPRSSIPILDLDPRSSMSSLEGTYLEHRTVLEWVSKVKYVSK